MTKTFFASRIAARNANIGTVRDAGVDAPTGQRWFVESTTAPEIIASTVPAATSIVMTGEENKAMIERLTTPAQDHIATAGIYEVSEADEVAASVEAAPASRQWTGERNQHGDPIASDPRLAKIYAELDYYGMLKTRDNRSRNQREGKYSGKGRSLTAKSKQWRTGHGIGRYDSLKESATFRKMIGI